jgi:hypothetical protein
MKSLKHVIAMSLCIAFYAPLTLAQPISDKRQEAQATNTIAQDVVIIIQQERVRFTAQKTVAEMQLQIYDQAGQLVYDSGVVAGSELIWVLRQANGETVKSGLYAYTLSVKDEGSETARARRGHLIVDLAKDRDGQTDRLWITSPNPTGVGTDLTVARDETTTVAGTTTSSERTPGQRAEGVNGDSGDRGVASEDQPQMAATKTGQAALTAGTGGFIAKFTSATDLGNSVITELNGNIGIGTANPFLISGGSERILSVSGQYNPGVALTNTSIGGNQYLLYSFAANQVGSGFFSIYDATNRADRFVITNSGAVGVGTTAPTSKLEIVAQDGLKINGYQPFLTLQDANASGKLGRIQSANGDLVFTPHSIIGQPPWAAMVVRDTANAGSRVDIYAQDALNMVGYQPFLTLTDSNAGWARIRIQNVNGGINFQTHDLTVAGGSAMYIQNGTQNIGIGTANPQAKLHVQGTTMTGVLQITGGADFAENFDVNLEKANDDTMAAEVKAGMVVSIDPANPGKLALSAQAYDRRVAGVISGAGGVKPGMVMSQEGTLADGKRPVALSGRVYCWADAALGAIEPGDLLTTAPTPGHAMKVTDPAKAQGAILGKAMTSLKEGRGLVLVLVTLQ